MRIPLAKNIPLQAPLTVHIETTNSCNFRCSYCPESLEQYGDIVGGYKSLTSTQFLTICQQLYELGPIAVMRLWVMGEPLLNKDLFNMVHIAKGFAGGRLTDRVEVTTNASGLTASRVEELLNSRLDLIKISIYGIGSRHRLITNSKVSDLKIYENVRRLRELRDKRIDSNLKIRVKMVDPVSNEELQSFKERYESLADELEVNLPHDWTDGDAQAFTSSVYTSVEQTTLETKRTGRKVVCPFPFYTLVIHANGDVSACCVDWNKKATIGSMTQNSLSEIWNGEHLREFRRLHLLGERAKILGCRNCDYYNDNCSENLDADREAILSRI